MSRVFEQKSGDPATYLNSIGIGKCYPWSASLATSSAATMDRSPSPPAPGVYSDTAKFMEMVRRFTGQTAPTNAAAAAQRGAVVRMLPLEPLQHHQPILATATAPGPRASGLGLQLALSPPLSTENPGPCVTNKAPDPRFLGRSVSASTISEEDEEAEEVQMEDPEEVSAIKEGRFYLLPSPENGGASEPKLLNFFPLAPSSSEGN